MRFYCQTSERLGSLPTSAHDLVVYCFFGSLASRNCGLSRRREADRGFEHAFIGDDVLVTWDVAIYAHWNISWRPIDIPLWVTRISNAYSDVCMRYAGRVAQICCLNSQYGGEATLLAPDGVRLRCVHCGAVFAGL